jgi:hypothetical protein
METAGAGHPPLTLYDLEFDPFDLVERDLILGPIISLVVRGD